MSPHFVTPYRKSQKNDGNDAKAICEAVGRLSMRFVPVKSESQQDVQALHRIRFQLIKWRTALANEIRGLLGEYGIVVVKGIAPLRRKLPGILDDGATQLSGLFREMFSEMAERLKLLDERIRQYDLKVERVFGEDDVVSVWPKLKGLVHWGRPRWLRQWVMPRSLRTGGNSAPGWAWAWSRANIPAAAVMSSWVSANAVIAICGPYSFTALVPPYAWSSDGRIRAALQ
jgi:Transposase